MFVTRFDLLLHELKRVRESISIVNDRASACVRRSLQCVRKSSFAFSIRE